MSQFNTYEVFRKSSVVDTDENGLPLTYKGDSDYWGVGRWVESNGDVRWVAAIGVPAEFEHLMPISATAVQLGIFDDERDACFVSMMFIQNLSENFHQYSRFSLHRQWRPQGGIPRWEFAASNVGGDDRVINRRSSTPSRPQRVIKLLSQIGEKFIREAFNTGIFGDTKLIELKKYGREMVLNEMKVLSVEEFGLRYGLI